MNRTTLSAVGVFAIAAVVLALLVYSWTRNTIVVQNASGQSVVSLTIAICGSEVRFGRLATGDEAAECFTIQADSSFEVIGELEDGTPVRGTFGYVTGGMYGHTATFSVQPDGTVVFDEG
jgi:hypothetical protein